jgi:hypothetical protein
VEATSIFPPCGGDFGGDVEAQAEALVGRSTVPAKERQKELSNYGWVNRLTRIHDRQLEPSFISCRLHVDGLVGEPCFSALATKLEAT